jgi:hypothetical protein
MSRKENIALENQYRALPLRMVTKMLKSSRESLKNVELLKVSETYKIKWRGRISKTIVSLEEAVTNNVNK